MINQTNLLCNLIEQNSERQQKITLDELAQFLSRSALKELLEKEWQRGIQNAQSLSIILAHADLSRAYSDTYCSISAEQNLRQVFQTIHSVVHRSSDLICRCGGEAFGIILPSTSVESTIHVATRIQKALKDAFQEHNPIAANQPITLSYGLSGLVPSPEMKSMQLLEAADTALRRAKSEGRNRIAVHLVEGMRSLPNDLQGCSSEKLDSFDSSLAIRM
jgi:diguanylate cyclase (GGDEF)-like protein